jgi:RecJ-like exonuclease
LGDEQGLVEKAKNLSNLIAKACRDLLNICIISHHDADGLTSAAIIAKAIMREGGRFNIRILSDLTQRKIEELAKEDYDLYILADLGGGFKEVIKKNFKNWLIIDHHGIFGEELEDFRILNAWQFGFDGGTEISASGLCYFIAESLSLLNDDLACLSVIGALGDRQDHKEGRSLGGLNERIVGKAEAATYLIVKDELLLHRPETNPIHVALAATDTPYIPGLSGNEDACLSFLTSLGLRLKEGERWRRVSELDDDEKKLIINGLIPYFGNNSANTIKMLIGKVYLLSHEDSYTPLRDAREFATLLNACGRMGKASVGISLLLGDRNKALIEAERILKEYRRKIAQFAESLTSNNRREERKGFVYIRADEVGEGMLGAITSIISSSPMFKHGILISSTLTKDGDVKISARGSKEGVNLGKIFSNLSKRLEGSGGGHSSAAGARIASDKLNEFLEMLENELSP